MIVDFFAGMFLFNAIPHLVMGISGKTHMTPFKRVSSPMLNIFWAFVNLLLFVLLMGMDPATGMLKQPTSMGLWVFMAGAFVMSMMNAWLFGKPDARLPWHKD